MNRRVRDGDGMKQDERVAGGSATAPQRQWVLGRGNVTEIARGVAYYSRSLKDIVYWRRGRVLVYDTWVLKSRCAGRQRFRKTRRRSFSARARGHLLIMLTSALGMHAIAAYHKLSF